MVYLPYNKEQAHTAAVLRNFIVKSCWLDMFLKRVWVMLKIMKPKCGKMAMKHEKWTPEKCPVLCKTYQSRINVPTIGEKVYWNKCPWCTIFGWLHYFQHGPYVNFVLTVLCDSVCIIIKVPGSSMTFQYNVPNSVRQFRRFFPSWSLNSNTMTNPHKHKWLIESEPKFHLEIYGMCHL